MVDSRILQTQAALSEAVLELAARTPIAKLGVAELTRRAGINRATFYDHYSSPGELLASVLGEEFETMRDDYLQGRRDGGSPQEVLRDGIDATIRHVEERREIYARALVDAPDPDLVGMLTSGFEDACFHILQETLDPPMSRPKARIVARFVGAGLVGGITAWLKDPALGRDDLVETLSESFPRWWY